MEITHIEHIAIAVKHLDEKIKYYENVLGFKCESIEESRTQKTRTAYFTIGQTKIYLVESTEPFGPIGRFIENKGEGIHHISFAVKDLVGALKEAASKGVQLIDTEPKLSPEGYRYAFLHPKSTHGVLTQLCELPK